MQKLSVPNFIKRGSAVLEFLQGDTHWHGGENKRISLKFRGKRAPKLSARLTFTVNLFLYRKFPEKISNYVQRIRLTWNVSARPSAIKERRWTCVVWRGGLVSTTVRGGTWHRICNPPLYELTPSIHWRKGSLPPSTVAPEISVLLVCARLYARPFVSSSCIVFYIRVRVITRRLSRVNRNTGCWSNPGQVGTAQRAGPRRGGDGGNQQNGLRMKQRPWLVHSLSQRKFAEIHLALCPSVCLFACGNWDIAGSSFVAFDVLYNYMKICQHFSNCC